jgi:hypothetical protein
VSARHQRLSPLQWPPFASRGAVHSTDRQPNWTLALADILAAVGPHSTAAAFLRAIECSLSPLRITRSVEFMSLADSAALDERSIVAAVRGTTPAVVLVVEMRAATSVTPEAAAFVTCLAHAAATITDLDENTDSEHADLVRQCRDLSEQLEKARALLEFLGETSRTYLRDSPGQQG